MRRLSPQQAKMLRRVRDWATTREPTIPLTGITPEGERALGFFDSTETP